MSRIKTKIIVFGMKQIIFTEELLDYLNFGINMEH